MNVTPTGFAFVTALLFVCIGATCADAACSASGLDTQIGLFRYGGDPLDFDTFQKVIAARFRQMSYEFDKPGQPDISGLQLSGPLNAPPDASAKVLKTYADANLQFLALWTGTIETKNDSKTAFSNIYLGRFNGTLAPPEVRLSLPVTMQDVSNTIDTHSMVTFYALAMNARVASCPANVVKALMDKASAKYQDLARRHYTDIEVDRVGQAIKDFEKSGGH